MTSSKFIYVLKESLYNVIILGIKGSKYELGDYTHIHPKIVTIPTSTIVTIVPTYSSCLSFFAIASFFTVVAVVTEFLWMLIPSLLNMRKLWFCSQSREEMMLRWLIESHIFHLWIRRLGPSKMYELCELCFSSLFYILFPCNNLNLQSCQYTDWVDVCLSHKLY